MRVRFVLPLLLLLTMALVTPSASADAPACLVAFGQQTGAATTSYLALQSARGQSIAGAAVTFVREVQEDPAQAGRWTSKWVTLTAKDADGASYNTQQWAAVELAAAGRAVACAAGR